ncbi:MAG: hypothetical protein CMD02_05155 [Flavobacteriales bacterium]|nr:hypothetical protein [Flavobacteriales bacterium]
MVIFACIKLKLIIKYINMKKILLSAFVLVSFLTFAQTNVSTTPENKNVVLEEFTGISCGYCPDGHVVAQGIKDNNPGDVMLINIHATSFANPQGPGTDFRTTEGTAINAYWQNGSAPMGTINRNASPMGRGSWAGAVSAELSQPSPVNVWSEAIIDMGTNTLTVNVEVYYTGSQTVTSNKINVAVLQNNIEGPQSGATTYNPAAVLANGNYNHTHMLRHLITGTWGDDITNVSQGHYETRTYTWNIPSDINGVDVDPTNLEIITFIAEGQQNILTGDYANTSIVFPNAYDANLTNTTATDIMCASSGTDLEVTFKNYGNIALTSLDINYSINGGTTTTYPWTGNLTSGGTETVTISQISVTPINTNNVDVSISNPNGNTDQNVANNDMSTTFSGMYEAPNGQISIDVTTDNYPSETTWELKENGVIIATGGPYSSTGPQSTSYATITSGNCYTFVMKDSYGDGILAPGNYKVKDVNNGTIIWGGTNSPAGNFTTEETSYFETESTSVSVEEFNSEISIYPNPAKDNIYVNGEFDKIKLYNVFGKLVFEGTDNVINTKNLSNGIYIVNLNTKDNMVTKKVTISK